MTAQVARGRQPGRRPGEPHPARPQSRSPGPMAMPAPRAGPALPAASRPKARRRAACRQTAGKPVRRQTDCPASEPRASAACRGPDRPGHPGSQERRELRHAEIPVLWLAPSGCPPVHPDSPPRPAGPRRRRPRRCFRDENTGLARKGSGASFGSGLALAEPDREVGRATKSSFRLKSDEANGSSCPAVC